MAKYKVEIIIEDNNSNATLQQIKEDIIFCIETLFPRLDEEDIKVERVEKNETSKAR